MHATSETLRPVQDEAAWDLFVFRKARESLCSERLRQQLLTHLRTALAQRDQGELLNCLIRAGEMECALADLGSSEAGRAAQMVDALAARTVQAEFAGHAPDLVGGFESLQLPPSLALSHAEGFSYYGLHPLDFWDLTQQIRLEAGSAAVIGIRSIGTTLSAIVCRALACRGKRAQRITVRPAGAPYQRHLELPPEQMRWVRAHLRLGSEFLVVDEGPGFSGSSFAAVGRALLRAGVPHQQIQFMGSRSPESAELQSRFDPQWKTFRFSSVLQGTRIPSAAKVYCAGGYWRRTRFREEGEWPACWTQLERNKYLSADGGSLFKFEGFGRYGESVAERGRQLADTGFAPPLLGCDNGFIEYAAVPGPPLRATQRNNEVLERLADYCAFRVATQTAAAPGAVALESMLQHNLQVEFGMHQLGLKAPMEKLVVADGRMMPYEWIAANGQLLKTDGASHGDDHLFPGPTDIAWDLAGVIAEWNLGREEQEFFLREYRRRSGDDAGSRLPFYLLAYSVFRMSCCRMAAAAMAAWEEETHRLRREYLRHRARVVSLLGLSEHGDRDAGLLSARTAQQAA